MEISCECIAILRLNGMQKTHRHLQYSETINTIAEFEAVRASEKTDNGYSIVVIEIGIIRNHTLL